MNIIKRIWVELYYLKLGWAGDYEMSRTGKKIIPCKTCGRPFLSWITYEGSRMVCTNKCKECEKNEL
jgi:hypothetical protein